MPDSGTARSALLDRVITHAATHGIADQSLRDLATGLGSSHRMLLYHFGSREGLIAAIVERVEAGQRQLLDSLGERHDDPAELIREHWFWLTQPETLAQVRLFYELAGRAVHGQPGTELFTEQFLAPWLAAGRRASETLGVPLDEALLRAGIALLRGLLLDVVITGDLAGATAALQRYLEVVQPGGESTH